MFRNGSDLEQKRPHRVTTDLIDGNIPTPEEIEANKSTWVKMKEVFTGKDSQP